LLYRTGLVTRWGQMRGFHLIYIIFPPRPGLAWRTGERIKIPELANNAAHHGV